MGAEAGWYDDGSGRIRWWDGSQWTDHYAESQQPSGALAGAVSGAVAGAGALLNRFTEGRGPAATDGTLWSAVGKPLVAIGAGRYRLTNEYLFFEKGTISTKSQQIKVHEIHDVDAAQSLEQKMRGVGTITLWARRSSGDEKVLLEDIPNFREGVEIINRVADEARHRLQARANTQHINYGGAIPGIQQPIPAPQIQAQQVNPSAGLNDELAKLAELRNLGMLDDEEFSAAKRRLLGL